MNKKRNEIIDILKGMAILAVIFGHAVQRGLVTNYGNTIGWKIVYSFHMPLFILLSGFTLYISTQSYDFKWVKNKIYRLIIPLISWTVIVQLMSNFKFTGLKPFTEFPDSIYKFIKLSIMHPDWAFWFLWVIFVFMMIFYVINKISRKYMIVQKYQPIFLVIVEAILIVLPKSHFGINYVVYYFPIFVCGYYISKYKDYILKYFRYALVPSILIWALLVNNYSNSKSTIVYKYVIAFSAMIAIYYFAKFFEKRLKWMIYLGKNSLQIYVAESICLNIGIGSGYIRVISIFVTATFFSILITEILKANKYTNLVAFGSHKKENNVKIKKTVSTE